MGDANILNYYKSFYHNSQSDLLAKKTTYLQEFHQIFRRGSPILQGGEEALAPFLTKYKGHPLDSSKHNIWRYSLANWSSLIPSKASLNVSFLL